MTHKPKGSKPAVRPRGDVREAAGYLDLLEDLKTGIRESQVRCKERNRVVAEYALRGISKPMGVAEYRGAEELPERLLGSLPTTEELEKELSAVAMPPAPVAEDGDSG